MMRRTHQRQDGKIASAPTTLTNWCHVKGNPHVAPGTAAVLAVRFILQAVQSSPDSLNGIDIVRHFPPVDYTSRTATAN